MQSDYEKHRFWLIVDGLLFVASGLLVIVPGPNVIGYYFAFRVVGHYLSWKGAKQGLDVVTWSTAPCAPLCELRDALRVAPPERDVLIDEIAARLHVPRLALFVTRMCWPGPDSQPPAGGAA
jgi:hypothetical protein